MNNYEMPRLGNDEAHELAKQMKDKMATDKEIGSFDDALVAVENEKMMEKYEERKALIKIPDEKLCGPFLSIVKKIQEGRVSEKQAFDLGLAETSSTYDFAEERSNNESLNNFLLQLLKNRTLINIGHGGEEGLFRADNHVKSNFPIKNQVVVDPFFKKDDMGEIIKEKEYKKMEFEQDDGLHFLISQPANNANIFISAVEEAVLLHGSENITMAEAVNWMKRLAQEAYRVVPAGGCFIVVNCSNELENEAKKLFEVEKTGDNLSVKIFIKPGKSEDKQSEQEKVKFSKMHADSEEILAYLYENIKNMKTDFGCWMFGPYENKSRVEGICNLVKTINNQADIDFNRYDINDNKIWLKKFMDEKCT